MSTDLSLFDRVIFARHKLLLIQAASESELELESDDGLLMPAIGAAAKEALELLGPVSSAINLYEPPREVLSKSDKTKGRR
jgi:hypothetical protein